MNETTHAWVINLKGVFHKVGKLFRLLGKIWALNSTKDMHTGSTVTKQREVQQCTCNPMKKQSLAVEPV